MPSRLTGKEEMLSTLPLSDPYASRRRVEGETNTSIPGFTFLPSAGDM